MMTSHVPSSSAENGYEVIDSGNGKKLERFGPYIIERPCSQAVWKPSLDENEWTKKTDASFSREGKSGWVYRTKSAMEEWIVAVGPQKMRLQTTEFGHIGIFAEQIQQWNTIKSLIETSHSTRKEPCKILNLFAYSGGSTLACALAGAVVCHLDSSKGMVDWARKNAELNGLHTHPIRWIVEDVIKFCKREQKRGSRYDGVILDPPSFGRGSKGEIFKIEDEIATLLHLVVSLLSDRPLFILFSCHTPGFTPSTMSYLMQDALVTRKIKAPSSSIAADEMTLISEGKDTPRPIPSGTFALWKAT